MFSLFNTKLMIIVILKMCMFMLSRAVTLTSSKVLKGTVFINQYVPNSKDHGFTNPHFHACIF